MKLPITYKHNFPDYGKSRAFNPKKIFLTEHKNFGDGIEKMHSKGVHTGLQFGPNQNQPNTGMCFKWGWDGLPKFTDAQLYAYLRAFIQQYGLTKRSIITDEIPENAQGTDTTIYDRMYHAYKGALDKFRETEPNLNKRDTGLFGSYGVDSFVGTLSRNWLYGSEAFVLQSLTTHVHKIGDEKNNSWSSFDASYYSSGQIDVRNLNASYYMFNGIFQIPYEIIYLSERIKVGSKTYQNVDRESDLIVFTWPSVQTLVIDEEGRQAGVEEARDNDLTEFPNGTISAYNTPALAGEYYTMGYWSGLITRGIYMWGSGVCGSDTTKLNHHTNAVGQVYFTPTGGSQEVYQSGVNGAPVRDESGISSCLATPIDAAYAGWEDSLEYTGYAEALYFASYTSSLGSFTAQPGAAGLHLNGFGPLNMGLMCMKHALDQKKAIALVGEGSAGRSVHYYNGFLSQHEYEDNVTLTYAGQSINIGRVYGRQTVAKKF